MHDIRLDKHSFDEIPIAEVMRLDPAWGLALSVHGPGFPVERAKAIEDFKRFAAPIEAEEKKLWFSKHPLRRDQLVLGYGGLPSGTGPDERGVWVGFLDLGPWLNWSHDCVYWFVAPDGHQHHVKAKWYPERWRELFIPVEP